MAWSWCQESGAARLCPDPACKVPGQAAPLRQQPGVSGSCCSGDALLPFLRLGGPDDCSACTKSLFLAGNQGPFSMEVTVTNKFAKTNITYSTTAEVGMPMFGVLNHLHKTNNSFNYTYIIYDTYGIFVNGVNGVNGSTENNTYWQLLSQKGSTIKPLSVGISCHIPKKDEIFIMNFTTSSCHI
ncbi:hypothetical protein cypCar_00034603 [Cyprinus carpio]|nr:hypothetical protein cypCar_00034603 [Cyprinus carpio]